jgi:2-oxoisovalerate dehydrogenase E2 component (dihydrolipoyl transacylase)
MALTTVKMPQLGESVTEGTVNRWLKQEGDMVGRDEPLVEVVTDKVNAEVPSPFAGKLAKIQVAEGETVPVGHALAELEVEGIETAATRSDVEVPPVSRIEPETRSRAKDSSSRIPLSPAARRLAEEQGVDLQQVRGSGPGGRVSRADVEAHLAQSTASSAASIAPPPPSTQVGEGEELIRVSAVRRQIADHLTKSISTVPHAWGMREVDMTALVQYREEHKEEFQQRHGIPLSYVPFVIQVVCDALRANPYLNSTWTDQGIILKHYINMGIAVALPDSLIVPVIKNADRLGLIELAHAAHDLASRARAGTLRPADVQGGTFTLNNTGANGGFASMSIINYPQAAILNTESITRRPVERGGAIVLRDIMNLTMSFDHRVLDGLKAGRFLGEVQNALGSWTPAAIKL